MNFDKVFKELIKGKKIRRKEWEPFMHLHYKDGEVKTYKGEYTNFYDEASILVSKGWMVLDGDGTELDFIQAIEEMKNKKKIINVKWKEENKERFIFINNNHFTMCESVEFKFMPTYQCLIANDWEVMQ